MWIYPVPTKVGLSFPDELSYSGIFELTKHSQMQEKNGLLGVNPRQQLGWSLSLVARSHSNHREKQTPEKRWGCCLDLYGRLNRKCRKCIAETGSTPMQVAFRQQSMKRVRLRGKCTDVFLIRCLQWCRFRRRLAKPWYRDQCYE